MDSIIPQHGTDAARNSADDIVGDFHTRAQALLSTITMPLHDLVLDPGDELTLTDDLGPDAAFARAFIPMRSYQRLVATGLDGLTSSIGRQPSLLQGRILVRVHVGADGSTQHIVIDGSRHVAALRQLAETGSANGVGLSHDVVSLFDACPVTIVHPETDPAFVLALLADATEPGADSWMQGQRLHLLQQLADAGVHHSPPVVAEATSGDNQVVRRYHAYRALQQMMWHEQIAVHEAVALYPLFHAAVGRTAIRQWLDWDDGLARFLDDLALDHFYRLLKPTIRADGTTRRACIRTVDDIVQLCDVLAEPAAHAVLLDRGGTLEEAMDVINAGVYQQFANQVGVAFESMRWDQRRFGKQGG